MNSKTDRFGVWKGELKTPLQSAKTCYLAAVTGSIRCSYFVPGYMTYG